MVQHPVYVEASIVDSRGNGAWRMVQCPVYVESEQTPVLEVTQQQSCVPDLASIVVSRGNGA